LTSLRLLRVALVSSLVLNVLLVTGFWLYIHYAGTLSLIQDVVGFFE
jgi:ABC-type transport system involved in cytochrome bd biosynthesis fused ATPase/permease subunit